MLSSNCSPCLENFPVNPIKFPFEKLFAIDPIELESYPPLMGLQQAHHLPYVPEPNLVSNSVNFFEKYFSDLEKSMAHKKLPPICLNF